MIIRPEHPTDAERAAWWRTGRPSAADLRDWKLQTAIDILREAKSDAEISTEDDPAEHSIAPSQVLPAAGFGGRARRLKVQEIEGSVPRNVIWSGTDAWTAAFGRHLAGDGRRGDAVALRESLRRNLLPTLNEQTALNRVLDEMLLREFVDIALGEGWTVERAAEIARDAATVNEQICFWLNGYAELDLLDGRAAPTPETALETWDRAWRQQIAYRDEAGRRRTCPRH